MEWRDIKGYEGLYQVSDTGLVKSLERTRLGRNGGIVPVPERILKPRKDRLGYNIANLNKDGRKMFYKITANGVEYPSINACARETGTSRAMIRYHLENGKPYKGVTYKRV